MYDARLVRFTLWLSFPFNLLAAYMIAFPASAPGQLIGLPAVVPPVYTALLSFMVLGFGLAYAWLAMQASIHRPLLAFGAMGKAGVFVILFALWLAGRSSGRVVLLASGDLAFASVWFWWLSGMAGRSAHALKGASG